MAQGSSWSFTSNDIEGSLMHDEPRKVYGSRKLLMTRARTSSQLDLKRLQHLLNLDLLLTTFIADATEYFDVRCNFTDRCDKANV